MAEGRPLAETTEPKNPRRKPAGCILASLGLMAVLLIAGGYVCLFRSVPLRISKETTYITGPLKPGGKEVDYFAAWEQETYPENIATEENGYRLIVEHLGAAPDATANQPDEICEKLGLAFELTRPDMTLEEPFDFLTAYVGSKDFDEAPVRKLAGQEEYDREPAWILEDRHHAPWSLNDLPMMEAWLAKNGAALDLIGQAVRKPTFHMPVVRPGATPGLIGLLLPEMQRMRSFARALHTRANYRIGTGDVDGAIDDIVACKRLGRQLGHGGPLVQVLVGIAIEGIAGAMGIAGSLEHRPTKQQLERFVAELDDLPPQAEFEEAFRFERYAALDLVQTMARNKKWVFPSQMPSGIGLDWSVVASRVNQHFDMQPATGTFPKPAFNPMAIVSLRARSEMVADTFSATMLPACGATREAMRRLQCVERMHRITLAMLLYERDHGSLPLACTVDGDGNPLHSWRVLLLPYLGQQALYDKIRLDEPWDSDHNRQFHNEAVTFYQCPSAELLPGHTTYSVVVGPEMPFEAGQGKPLSKFGPKSANMILIVERLKGACWMNPRRDVPQSVAGKGIGIEIGSRHPGGANFGFRDGSVRFISETIDGEVFKKLLYGTADKIP
jgi:prepilin-type processing-associated H-X9-DG protein